MKNEEQRIEKENITNGPQEDKNLKTINGDMEVFLNQENDISEEVVIIDGQDSMLTEDITSAENDNIILTEYDDEIFVDVDSDMYGGPLPEDFYCEDINFYDLSSEINTMYDEELVSGDESEDKNYIQNSDLD